MWGNCQAEALRLLLDAVPDRPYRTVRVPPVHEIRSSDLPFVDALLRQTAVLLSQPVRQHYRDLPIGTADLIRRLPTGAAAYRWPVIRYAGLYPFQAIARHPADRSITPPGVPYHDLRTVAAACRGAAADDEWDIDVSDDQIRTAAAASRSDLARRERDTDVGIADAIATYGADAAHTINHPGDSTLRELARRVLALCDLPDTLAPIDGGPLLGSAYAPLEPRVIAALGITATPRPQWRLQGVELDPQDVHATQIDWYRRYPEFIDVTVRRHRKTMQTLGLIGAST
ncbi:WcbI family polysaccharide biosynthesis putative acetyltransferase [Mycobacterium sp.]|uniref:WcbI family polysaccharide biosynthesis putative acetyltransferase n=1 Tax=Mycobacterium sp. TaxID=1785 RepID=UPI0025FA58C3|nr:WcbI family polysaccharide biosynthesis putative acetyltransferase [Mycobacterium sp.]